MPTKSKDLLDNLFRSVSQATATNVRLQQELLLGWTRLWPGLAGRGSNPCESVNQFCQHWTDSTASAIRAQHDLLSEQFDAAMSLIDPLAGSDAPTKEPAASPPAPPKKPAPTPAASEPTRPAAETEPAMTFGPTKNIAQKVAVVTGAGSGIGEAVSRELADRGAKAVILVDRSDVVEDLAKSINEAAGRTAAVPRVGDTTDQGFRKTVFSETTEEFGPVTICVPAAGITRDGLSVKMDKETGKAEIYPIDTFRQVTEVNLLAPIYWGIEMVARIAEDRKQRGLKRWEPEERIQGVVVFLGSVSSQGNKGQISYAVAKAGLEGAAATLQKEAIFHGVRCGIIHPGFTDTPMARALGDDFLGKYVLPYTQLRRLIHPEEIADAICFMISNSAVSGELWADAGWHPPA